MAKAPKHIKPQKFTDPASALAAIEQIYDSHIAYLRASFDEFVAGEKIKSRVSACYPYIKVVVKNTNHHDRKRSYGFVPRPGAYSTTVTRPDIFGNYYRNQIEQLMENHEVPVEIGVSNVPIPIHFALGSEFHPEKSLNVEQVQSLSEIFDVPNLDIMDDDIANGVHIPKPGEDPPLALFTAQRVDLSLQRLKHYCGTSAYHFQNYVIFTNYQFYLEEFVKLGRKQAQSGEYNAFVEPEPGRRLPQMPAYHLKRADGSGITMVNIGVGPSNAKTITDHIAVLRPHAWLMLGHCAGLRNSQKLGDYVLAHGYLREDNILDADLPPNIPLPALSEIQISLEKAVSEVTGLNGLELKKIMRTGTVATTDDRNWELRSSVIQNRRLSQSRAIAMDMESGTIAANGFRFRVPYGTLLCVSDKPLHGDLKLPGMADSFYRERVEQHLKIGLLTMKLLRAMPQEKLHSRKLRSFNEVAFQ